MKSAIAALLLACGILVFVGVTGGLAHENPTDWIGQERRKNGKGELCCGAGVDCHAIVPTRVKVTPTGYQLPDGEIIPFNKAAPSADQFFWECKWGGERKCFFAPFGGA